jgi:hypothetical protein
LLANLVSTPSKVLAIVNKHVLGLLKQDAHLEGAFFRSRTESCLCRTNLCRDAPIPVRANISSRGRAAQSPYIL